MPSKPGSTTGHNLSVSKSNNELLASVGQFQTSHSRSPTRSIPLSRTSVESKTSEPADVLHGQYTIKSKKNNHLLSYYEVV